MSEDIIYTIEPTETPFISMLAPEEQLKAVRAERDRLRDELAPWPSFKRVAGWCVWGFWRRQYTRWQARRAMRRIDPTVNPFVSSIDEWVRDEGGPRGGEL